MNADKRQYHLLVHKGAMGDFLLVWPAMLSLARAYSGNALFWAGKECHSTWIQAAGWEPAPLRLRNAVDTLYGAAEWPATLEGGRVTWFGLRANVIGLDDPRLWFVPCIQEGRFASPRQIAREALAAHDIAWAGDWRDVWRGAFGGWQKRGPFDWDLLLFPGAGHRAKQWGAVQFFELARYVEKKGWRVGCVLGPVEVERGLNPLSVGALEAAVIRPQSFSALSELLLRTRMALGNDSGPMHLASMHGTPGIVLFGPTSRRQWAPEGMPTLAAATPCRPCTVTTSDIDCSDFKCMNEISVARAAEALQALRAVGC